MNGNHILLALALFVALLIVSGIRAMRTHVQTRTKRVSEQRYRKLWVVDEDTRKGNHED